MRASSPLWIALGRLGASLLSFASAPVLARILGPEGRGITAAVLAAAFIAPALLSLGLPFWVRRQSLLGRGRAATRNSRLLIVLTTPVAFAIGVAASIALLPDVNATTLAASITAIASAPLTVWWMCDEGRLLAVGAYRQVAWLLMVQPAVVLAAVLVGFFPGWVDVPFVLYASSAGAFLTVVYGCIAVARVSTIGEDAEHRMRMLPTIAASIKFYIPTLLEATAARLTSTLALPLAGAYAAGLYSVAATLASAPVALGHAAAASHARTLPDEDGVIRRDSEVRGVRQSLAIGIAVTAVGAPLSPWLVPLVFGQEFASSAVAVMVAMAGLIFLVPSQVLITQYVLRDKAPVITVAQLSTVASQLILSVILAPLLGATGLAIAWLVGSIALFITLTARSPWITSGLGIAPRDFVEGARLLWKGGPEGDRRTGDTAP